VADRSSASWLAGKILLAAVEGELAEGPVAAQLSRDGETTAVEGHAFPIPASSRQDGAPEDTFLLVTSLATDVTELDGWSLSARTSRSEWELPLPDPEVASDVKTLVRQFLAPLDAETRNRAIDFLARTAGGEERDVRTCETLLGIREALRERLPIQENTPENRRGLAADVILRVNDGSFYLKGWMHDEEAEIVRLTAVSPEGTRVELLEKLFRESRSDVADWSTEFGPEEKGAEYGFICFVELEAPSLLRGPWVLEMENADGTAVEITAPTMQEEILPARAMILNDCANRRVLEEDLMVDHIMPAIMRIQRRTAGTFEIDTVVQHGEPPPAPDVSIIVPIYMNIEYLEGQLAEFASDPAISQSDLIFVLDSPEQANWLDYWSGELYPIYRVPFRVVTLEHNVGYAGANNAGASVARGRLLLLLNSDVLPDKPGWLETMRDFYDSKPSIGALAPKLLYEDDSIQHAGMYFQKRQAGQDIVDSHYFRGLHRTFPGANVPRTVPAVTGACMMIARDLYEEFEGLSYQYVQGDYEDFDLCLRLSQAGRENWYVPDAELYHLEAQSYEPALRGPANRYNQWLNGHVWKDQLEELTDQSRLENSLITAGERDQGAR
jgi:GT2 family glycosyltransferase